MSQPSGEGGAAAVPAEPSTPVNHISTSPSPSQSPSPSLTQSPPIKHKNGPSSSSPTSPLPLKLDCGHHSEQGTRPTMEDEVLICESFDVPASTSTSTSTSSSSSSSSSTAAAAAAVRGPLSFYGVFDGHGGRQAAIFTKQHIHQHIIKQLQAGKQPQEALTQAYLQIDQDFIDQCRDTSGTTAVCILIEHSTRRLWVANVGDSRAVLCRKGTVLALTRDHKADRPDEVERIRKAGGFVVHKRVMGELAISRAIGDVDFKEKGFLFVLADPEVGQHDLSPDDEFLLIACDGLYDVMSNESACDFIRASFKQGDSCQETAQKLVQHAISELHTRDNVTVIIVRLKQPHTIEIVQNTPATDQHLTEEVVQVTQNQDIKNANNHDTQNKSTTSSSS